MRKTKHCYRSNKQQDFAEAKSLAGFQEMLAGQDHPDLAGYIFEELCGILEGIELCPWVKLH